MVVNLGPQLRALFYAPCSRARRDGPLRRGAAASSRCAGPSPAICLTRIKQSAGRERNLRLGTNQESLHHVSRAANHPV